MKKIITTIIIMLPVFLMAQSAERQVIGAAGGFAATTELQVSSTVGEPIIGSSSSTTIILSQGFQQPEESTQGIVDIETGLSINAYPNPSKSLVTLQLDAPNAMELNVSVIDNMGKPIRMPINKLNILGTSTHEIDFSDLPAGNYNLLLFNTNGNFKKTIKLLKLE